MGTLDGNPATVGTGHGFRECGGKASPPKHDRSATPTYARKGRNRGGRLGTAPGGRGNRGGVALHGALRDAAMGDSKIVDMTAAALQG